MAQYPEVKQISDIPKKLVVLLHGVGSDGNDMISLVPFMQYALPDCYFIAPHGIEPFDMAPVGHQWFSLNDRSPSTIQRLIPISARSLASIIAEKQLALSLTNKDTIIIGFSQGTMLGLYLTLTTNEHFACMIGFSGALVPPARVINNMTPICLIHGKEDNVLGISEMQVICDYLESNKIKHSSLVVPNLAHSIDASGIKYAIKFIQNN